MVRSSSSRGTGGTSSPTSTASWTLLSTDDEVRSKAQFSPALPSMNAEAYSPTRSSRQSPKCRWSDDASACTTTALAAVTSSYTSQTKKPLKSILKSSSSSSTKEDGEKSKRKAGRRKSTRTTQPADDRAEQKPFKRSVSWNDCSRWDAFGTNSGRKPSNLDLSGLANVKPVPALRRSVTDESAKPAKIFRWGADTKDGGSSMGRKWTACPSSSAHAPLTPPRRKESCVEESVSADAISIKNAVKSRKNKKNNKNAMGIAPPRRAPESPRKEAGSSSSKSRPGFDNNAMGISPPRRAPESPRPAADSSSKSTKPGLDNNHSDRTLPLKSEMTALPTLPTATKKHSSSSCAPLRKPRRVLSHENLFQHKIDYFLEQTQKHAGTDPTIRTRDLEELECALSSLQHFMVALHEIPDKQAVFQKVQTIGVDNADDEQAQSGDECYTSDEEQAEQSGDEYYTSDEDYSDSDDDDDDESEVDALLHELSKGPLPAFRIMGRDVANAVANDMDDSGDGVCF